MYVHMMTLKASLSLHKNLVGNKNQFHINSSKSDFKKWRHLSILAASSSMNIEFYVCFWVEEMPLETCVIKTICLKYYYINIRSVLQFEIWFRRITKMYKLISHFVREIDFSTLRSNWLDQCWTAAEMAQVFTSRAKSPLKN